jgi:hypothetical protein
MKKLSRPNTSSDTVTRQHIRHIFFWKWFPSDDPVAASVARLCILREDLYLETTALIEESIPSLDKNGVPWRTMYFWRNSVRTLLEIRSALQVLRSNDEFLSSLSIQPEPFRKAFEKLEVKIRAAHEFLKDVRNEVGGHVKHQPVKMALATMDMDRKALIELGPTIAESHYKFAGELVAEILLREIPYESRETYLKEKLGMTAELTGALHAIDIVLLAYADARRLMD